MKNTIDMNGFVVVANCMPDPTGRMGMCFFDVPLAMFHLRSEAEAYIAETDLLKECYAMRKKFPGKWNRPDDVFEVSIVEYQNCLPVSWEKVKLPEPEEEVGG